jgi:proteasome lid subunit RPN8/RPN11
VLKFHKEVLKKLVHLCKSTLPKKSFGLLAGSENVVKAVFPFIKNLRTDPSIDAIFKKYGRFYCSKEKGFWADPEEQLETMKIIKNKKLQVMATYHTHHYLPPYPTKVDIDLHYDPAIPLLILSFSNPEVTVIKAYKIYQGVFEDIGIGCVK